MSHDAAVFFFIRNLTGFNLVGIFQSCAFAFTSERADTAPVLFIHFWARASIGEVPTPAWGISCSESSGQFQPVRRRKRHEP